MQFRIKTSNLRKLVFSLTVLVVGGAVGYYIGKGEVSIIAGEKNFPKVIINTSVPSEVETSSVDFSLFWQVWQKLETTYLDPKKMDAQKMVYGAIEGMTSALGDPYTVFLPPADQQRTTEDLSGAFEGLGIQLGYVERQLAVMTPIKGSPAEAAGVKAGDLILHIKDEKKGFDKDTMGMSLPDAVNVIRGAHGEAVILTLYRPDEENSRPFEISIKRDTIVIPTVELEFIDSLKVNGKIAHLSLSRFGGRTEDEWNQAVNQIVADSKVKGVMLDLRNNPGGYLNGAIFIASEFIDSGIVVKQQGKEMTETYSVNRKGKLTQMPVVVLINKGSASASEIVAGALRDRRNAKLVGTRSFGKGTVQNVIELPYGSGMHITVARWLLPNGDWIHENGIPPTIEASESGVLKEVDPVVQKALDAF